MTGGSSILVVEDEALLLWDISDELTTAGYKVYTASNADEAIAVLERHPDIGAIFTDINMPGSMDGLKLSHAVRDRWPPVKIIVTSGVAKGKEIDLPLGGAFLAKPYEPSHVISTLQRLFA